MGPAGPLSLLPWTHTVLSAIASSEGSPGITNGGVVRQKRQYTASDTIGEILLRITIVEENVTKTESAVENISEHLAALGFQLNPNEADLRRSQNPCEKYSQDDLEGQNEMPWTLWGNSKCVKLLSGLSTFSDATARCRQQQAKEQDIAYPAVVSFDSSNNAASLLGLLRERMDESSVWVGRRSPSAVLICTEMKVTSSSEEQVAMKGVDCGVLNRVVCEKPLPLSFVELAEGHLETMQRVGELETEMEELRRSVGIERQLRVDEVDELRQSLRTLRDSLTSGQGVFDPERPRRSKSEPADPFKCHVSSERKERLGKLERGKLLLESQVARLEGNSALGEEELRRKVELLKGQLGKQLTSTAEEKTLRAEETRQLLINLETETSVKVSKVKERSESCGVAAETEGAELNERLDKAEATLRRLVGTLDQKMSTTQTLVDATEVSTTLPVTSPTWELRGQTAFNVSQAMGGWRWIEVFGWDSGYTPDPCEEYIFSLRGSTVEWTWRWGNSGDNGERKRNFTVDTQSPHQWTSEGWASFTWVKTDYANWAVLMWCRNKELSSCVRLRILSRERTLPPATLEMLRNVAEQRGFPKARGALVDQTSC